MNLIEIPDCLVPGEPRPGGDGPHVYAQRAFYHWCRGRNSPLSPAEWDDFLAFQQAARGEHAAFSIIERLLPHLTDRWGTDAASLASRAGDRQTWKPDLLHVARGKASCRKEGGERVV